MERVDTGAHLPTSWLFELAKRPDDRAVYCVNCSFLSQCKHQVLVFTFEWSVKTMSVSCDLLLEIAFELLQEQLANNTTL